MVILLCITRITSSYSRYTAVGGILLLSSRSAPPTRRSTGAHSWRSARVDVNYMYESNMRGSECCRGQRERVYQRARRPGIALLLCLTGLFGAVLFWEQNKKTTTIQQQRRQQHQRQQQLQPRTNLASRRLRSTEDGQIEGGPLHEESSLLDTSAAPTAAKETRRLEGDKSTKKRRSQQEREPGYRRQDCFSRFNSITEYNQPSQSLRRIFSKPPTPLGEGCVVSRPKGSLYVCINYCSSPVVSNCRAQDPSPPWDAVTVPL